MLGAASREAPHAKWRPKPEPGAWWASSREHLLETRRAGGSDRSRPGRHTDVPLGSRHRRQPALLQCAGILRGATHLCTRHGPRLNGQGDQFTYPHGAPHLVNRQGRRQEIELRDVLYVPTLPSNLLSASVLRRRGIYFSTLDHTLRQRRNHAEVGYAPSQMGLNVVRLTRPSAGLVTALPVMARSPSTAMLWHQRLGHAGRSLLGQTQRCCRGMDDVSFLETFSCDTCHLSKSQRVVSRHSVERATIPFARIHVDVIGHITPTSSHGERWVVLLTDDLTRHRWCRVVTRKGDAYDVVRWFVRLVKTHHAPCRVLEIVLDGGREFGGNQLTENRIWRRRLGQSLARDL